MNRDLRLREDVERELGWEPGVPSSEIGVGVKDGVVTLMGAMGSYAAKRAAERAAIRVREVKAVSSQLTVKPAGPADRTDADIAWAAVNALSWNPLVSRDRIRVQVSSGWITLEGSADSAFQSTAAQEAVAKLAGVTGVTNLVVVQPGIASEELKERIEKALQGVAELDASRIVIDIDGDRVTLWGCVNSWPLREAAEQAAWSASGVSEVSNHITVELAVAAGS